MNNNPRDSKDNNNNTGNDAGNNNNNTGNDAGNNNNNNGNDAGVSDGGQQGSCPANTEGCPCTADPMNPAGTCNAGLSCVRWNAVDVAADPQVAPVETCVRTCETSADCSDPAMPTCSTANTIGLQQNQILIFGYCRGDEIPEGGECSVSNRLGTGVTGCREGSECNLGFFGDGDVGECAHICAFTATAPQSDCPNDLPFCNPVFTATSASQGLGICSPNNVPPGSDCGALILQCNDRDFPGNGCYGLQDDQGNVFPTCLMRCDSTQPNPDSFCDPVSSGAPASCITVQAGFDFCSSGCTQFPETCDVGAACTQVLTSVSYCQDVGVPQTIPETVPIDFGGGQFTFQGAVSDCSMEPQGCVHGTFCVQLMGGVGCVRGCTTMTSTTHPRGGCEDSPSATAVCSAIQGQTIGICAEPL